MSNNSFIDRSHPAIPDVRNRLIIFIHGLKGSEDSWYSSKEVKFVNALREHKNLRENYKYVIYQYDTQLVQFRFWRRLLNIIVPGYLKRMNQNIRSISEVLETYIRDQSDYYNQIILVGHSMGGLIAKRTIVKLGDIRLKIPYYFSFSTPHFGSKLAKFGWLVGNPQIKNLRLFSEFITTLNQDFSEIPGFKPSSIYQYGSNDGVVDQNSAIPSGTKRKNQIITTDNHFSVLNYSKQNRSYIRLTNELEILVNEFTLNDWMVGPYSITFPDNGSPYTFRKTIVLLLKDHVGKVRAISGRDPNAIIDIWFDPKFSEEQLNLELQLQGREIEANNFCQLIKAISKYEITKNYLPNYAIEVSENQYKLLIET